MHTYFSRVLGSQLGVSFRYFHLSFDDSHLLFVIWLFSIIVWLFSLVIWIFSLIYCLAIFTLIIWLLSFIVGFSCHFIAQPLGSNTSPVQALSTALSSTFIHVLLVVCLLSLFSVCSIFCPCPAFMYYSYHYENQWSEPVESCWLILVMTRYRRWQSCPTDIGSLVLVHTLGRHNA